MAGRLLHPSDDNGVTPSSGASITIGDFEYVFITAVSPRNDEASLGLARLNSPGIVIPWTNEISNLGWINKAAVINRKSAVGFDRAGPEGMSFGGAMEPHWHDFDRCPAVVALSDGEPVRT